MAACGPEKLFGLTLGFLLPLFPPPAPPPPAPAPPPSAAPAPAQPHRWTRLPVGLARVENQVLNSARYRYAVRFVAPRTMRLRRFLSGFVIEGARGVGPRRGYGRGSGGVILARLVGLRRNGTPDLRRVLAREKVGAVRRYRQTVRLYGIGQQRTQLLYFKMGNVRLRAGRAYAVVYSNASRRPSRNFFSTNSPTIRPSQAGPNGRNTTDRRATRAIAGLDPREAVAWSRTSGRRWVWGRRVGEGRTPGAYAGARDDDSGTRLPWYGLVAAGASQPESRQPLFAYGETGSYTLVVRGARRATGITGAGGYAPRGRRVGRVTVSNLRTGVTGRTGSLGGAIAAGTLDRTVPVAAGDPYAISNTGTVNKAEADFFIRQTFGFERGPRRWPFLTVGHGADRAQLFVLPDPLRRR